MSSGLTFEVSISPALLETMTLAGIDAYALGKRKGGAPVSLETAGFVWGFTRLLDNTKIFYLDRGCHNVSGTRTPRSVAPDPDAARMMTSIYGNIAPYLTLLGDFHTHPYKDLDEVKDEQGYEFSPQDYASFLGEDVLWEQSNENPVMLVLTVARLQRVRETILEWPRKNIKSWSIGEFRLWLNAVVGYVEDGERVCTGDKHSPVYLSLPGFAAYNPAGSRVGPSLHAS